MTELLQPPRKRSKHTEERHMPGAFEGETVSRRRLLAGSAHAAGAIAAAAFTLPALGFAVGPVFDDDFRGRRVGGPPPRPLDRSTR